MSQINNAISCVLTLLEKKLGTIVHEFYESYPRHLHGCLRRQQKYSVVCFNFLMWHCIVVPYFSPFALNFFPGL